MQSMLNSDQVQCVLRLNRSMIFPNDFDLWFDHRCTTRKWSPRKSLNKKYANLSLNENEPKSNSSESSWFSSHLKILHFSMMLNCIVWNLLQNRSNPEYFSLLESDFHCLLFWSIVVLKNFHWQTKIQKAMSTITCCIERLTNSIIRSWTMNQLSSNIFVTLNGMK